MIDSGEGTSTTAWRKLFVWPVSTKGSFFFFFRSFGDQIKGPNVMRREKEKGTKVDLFGRVTTSVFDRAIETTTRCTSWFVG